MFVAISLFVVVLVWVNNYASLYVNSIGTASNYQQLNSIATSTARVFNYGCAYNESITYILPCASNEGEMIPVNVTANNGVLTVALVENNSINTTRQLLCSSNSTIIYECTSEDGPYACISNYSNGVALNLGMCNNTTI